MTDFFLASFPRSGNTYIRLLLNHHFGIDSKSVAGEEQDSRGKMTTGIHEVWGSKFGHIAWKTHYPVQDYGFEEINKTAWPAILVVRDGRDALISHAHYQMDFWNIDGTVHGVCERMILPGIALAGDWTKFHEYWLQRENYIALKYEDLMQEPLDMLRRALQVLELPFEIRRRDPLPAFSKFHEDNPKFFRRGTVGGWRDEMPPDLEELFWKYHGEMMEILGYER